MHKVKCIVCGLTFDADKIPFKKTSNGRRYAHEECPTDANQQLDEKSLLLLQRKQLYDYIDKVYDKDVDWINTTRQIEEFKNQNMTYSGMLKSLIYWYEVLGHSIKEDARRVGIIPYIYYDSYKYYESIYNIEQINKDKELSATATQTFIVKAPQPKKKPLWSIAEDE